MTIREVLAQLARVQARVSVTEPYPAEIVRVYPYLPPGQDDLDTPCVINQWRLLTQTLRPNGFREQRYVIRSQVFVADLGADYDAYSEVAAALHDKLLEEVAAHLTLDHTASMTGLRGDEAEYMPVVFERNGKGYVGLQYLMDVVVHDAVTVGP